MSLETTLDTKTPFPLAIDDEFSPLSSVIIGLGAPYQPDKEQVAGEMQEFPFIPDTERKAEVLALTYPDEAILEREFADYVAVLARYGIEVLRADPALAYSFDYTCPRDIGFVIGDTFFIANMSVSSRAEEYKTIMPLLEHLPAEKVIRPPDGVVIEGGDVVVLDERTILVGVNQRTHASGYEFLRDYFRDTDYEVVPVPHRQLHLDCCLNPLGLGHLLIHSDSLLVDDEPVWQVLKQREWVEIDAVEREHLATNMLSIRPDTVIARDHSACARVNEVLRELGYTVEEVGFDGVPAVGGSFRCASLVLARG
ncbi:MAG: dimethylarginine dimethylaminohydrolase family protein [Thiolinea sp.]